MNPEFFQDYVSFHVDRLNATILNPLSNSLIYKTYVQIIPGQSSLSASAHSKISYFSGHFIFLKLKLTDIKVVVTSVPDLEIFRMWFYDSAD